MSDDTLKPLSPFDRIAADRLADEVAVLVTNRHLDSRSAAADALLDYREPPRTPRSDRLAELEARVRELEVVVRTSGEALAVAEEYRLNGLDRIAALEAENAELRREICPPSLEEK